MRHGKKLNHLGRKAPHRKAMLRNMAISLIEHKRITTTVAKAKALRKFVEPLVTKAKNADSSRKESYTHARRLVFSYLQNKYAVTELFDEVVPKVGDRPGGYTRILKIGNRAGDNAEMAFIEFVDFNELAPGKVSDGGANRRRRRRRRGGKKGGSSEEANQPIEETQVNESVEAAVEETAEAVIPEAEVVEEVVDVAADEEVVAEVEEVVEASEAATEADDTPATEDTSAEAGDDSEEKKD